MEVLRRDSEAFFGAKVTVIDEAVLSEKSEKEFVSAQYIKSRLKTFSVQIMTLHNHSHKITARYNDMTGNNQLCTKDILRMLKKMLDHYPSGTLIVTRVTFLTLRSDFSVHSVQSQRRHDGRLVPR